jgi:uncharacterized protein YkwD
VYVALAFQALAADKDEKPKLSKSEETILRLTNELRAKEKLPPLAHNALLREAAQKHSENMAKQGKLDHVLDDKNPADRVDATGYKKTFVGENIASGQRLTPAKAFDLWVDSPPHKKNILGDKFDEIGIGIATDDKGGIYYTQVFGSTKKHPGASSSKKPTEREDEAAFEKARADILKKTNEARAKKDLPALELNAVLTRVANGHSANMAKQEKVAHVLDDKRPGQRIADAGYKYAESAENVATSEDIQVKEIFDAWMESKSHRENILGETFTEIGIGIARGTNGDIYYTQVFAKPRKK